MLRVLCILVPCAEMSLRIAICRLEGNGAPARASGSLVGGQLATRHPQTLLGGLVGGAPGGPLGGGVVPPQRRAHCLEHHRVPDGASGAARVRDPAPSAPSGGHGLGCRAALGAVRARVHRWSCAFMNLFGYVLLVWIKSGINLPGYRV